MKAKKKILSLVVALAVAAAVFPICAYADTNVVDDVQNRAVAQQIRSEKERFAREAAKEEERVLRKKEQAPEVEAADADFTTVTVNSGSYTVEQGGRMEISYDDLTIEGENPSYSSSVDGIVTLSGAETYEVNYYSFDIFQEKYQDGAYVHFMVLYVPREVKPGTYAVTVDFATKYTQYIINGNFNLTVTDSAVQAPVISGVDEDGNLTDSVAVNYNESFNIESETGYLSGIYTISSDGGKKINLLSNDRIDYETSFSAGDYALSAFVESYYYDYEKEEYVDVYAFSNSVKLTLKQPEKIEVDQVSASELSYSYENYNNEIAFSRPFVTGGYDYGNNKVINKQTGEIIFGNTVHYEFVYNKQVNEESGEISYEYTGVILTGRSLPEGEYELYLYLDGKEIGPIAVKCYSYDLQNLYYTTLNKVMTLGYRFYYTDPIREADIVSANISVSDENGSVLRSVEVEPEYYYSGSSNFNFIIDTPSVSADGVYLLSTEFKFADGTTRQFMDRHIFIGEYYVPSYISTDHEYITPATMSIGVSLGFDDMISDPNDIYFTLIDPSGEEIGRSSKFYTTSLCPSSAIYIIELKRALSDVEPGYEYIIKANSAKNIEFKGRYTQTSIVLNDVPIVVGSKRVAQNSYEFIMENIQPGTYNTYHEYQRIDGILKVESNGEAVLTMSDPESYSIYSRFYLQTEDVPIMIEVSFETYFEYVDLPSIETMAYSYIVAGASSAKNIGAYIYTQTMPKSDDFISARLLSGGNVIAEGENIRVGYPYYAEYMDCWSTNLLVDFPSIDMSKATDGSAVLQIITTFGEITADYTIVADNVPAMNSYIQINSGTNYVSCSNLSFEIRETNFTEGEIQLYEIGEETDYGQDMIFVASKPLSELKRNDGLLYDYSGAFNESLEPDKKYTLKYYNEKLEDAGGYYDHVINYYNSFTATDKPMIFSDNNNYVGYNKQYVSGYDKQYVYGKYVNLNCDSDKIEAYYESGGNRINIPLIAKKAESYDEFGEIYDNVNQVLLSFDFSKVPSFEKMDVHIVVNDEEAGIIKFYDYREKCFIPYADIAGNDDTLECIRLEGYNLAKGDIRLEIYNIDEYNCKMTIGDKIRDINLNTDFAEIGYFDFYVSPLDSLYLPEGKYYYQLCMDGVPILSDVYGDYLNGNFTIGAAEADPDIPVAVIGNAVEGSEMKVDLLNMSGGEIKANVIVGAYDENGALIDLSGEVPVTIAPNGELKGVSVPTAADAARYKVFVWDSLKDMRPYSKAN